MNGEKLHRLLRPIYDAIDGHHYKNAIKLCSHKKIHELDIVQVLKAHCLERLGQTDEALEICYRVQESNPLDETTLSTMYLVFKLSGHGDRITSSYEYAVNHPAHKDNLEIFKSLFCCYVRQFDFAKQQQLALKMFKNFQEPKYLYWACVSMFLQVRQYVEEHPECVNQELPKTQKQLLSLAEKMLQKVVVDNQDFNSEAVGLLIDILVEQGKYEEVLEVYEKSSEYLCKMGKEKSNQKPRALEGNFVPAEDIDLGPMQEIDQLTLEASVYDNLKDWNRSSETYLRLLKSFNPDDWSFMKGYINAMFQLAEVEENVSYIDLLRKNIGELQAVEKKRSGGMNRGPFLGAIETQANYIAWKKKTCSCSQEDENCLVELMREYIEYFGKKTCCFTDLKQYLDRFLVSDVNNSEKLSKQSRDVWIEYMEKIHNETDFESLEETNDAAQLSIYQNLLKRHIFALKSLRYLGYFIEKAKTSETTSIEKVNDLLALYQRTLWLNGTAAGGQREVQHGDDLVLLTCHSLLDLYNQLSLPSCIDSLLDFASPVQPSVQNTDATLLEKQYHIVSICIALLLYALKQSPYNFQFKILIIQLYGMRANYPELNFWYQQLGVKQILLDSLSYLTYDMNFMKAYKRNDAPLRNLSEAHDRIMVSETFEHQSQTLCYFHRANERDLPDYVCKGYKHSLLSKVIDISTCFLTKFRWSAAKVQAQLDLLLEELVWASKTFSSFEKFVLKSEPEEKEREARKQREGIRFPLDSAGNFSRLRFNQDRSIRSKWDCPLSPMEKKEGFGFHRYLRDGNVWNVPDRLSQPSTMQQWLRMRCVVYQLIESGVNEKVDSSFEKNLVEYQWILKDLKLTRRNGNADLLEADNDDVNSLESDIWSLSLKAIKLFYLVSVSLESTAQQNFSADSSSNEPLAELETLKESLSLLSLRLVQAMPFGNGLLLPSKPSANLPYSAYGVNLISVFFSQSGHWCLLFLALTLKHFGGIKKGKKIKSSDCLDATGEKIRQGIKDCISKYSEILNCLEDSASGYLQKDLVLDIMREDVLQTIDTSFLQVELQEVEKHSVLSCKSIALDILCAVEHKKEFIHSLRL